jgi:hypothetical protein
VDAGATLLAAERTWRVIRDQLDAGPGYPLADEVATSG